VKTKIRIGINNNNAINIDNNTGIHIGEKTHNQDQLITPVNFKIKKVKNKNPDNFIINLFLQIYNLYLKFQNCF
jgi:hypothetical protein